MARVRPRPRVSTKRSASRRMSRAPPSSMARKTRRISRSNCGSPIMGALPVASRTSVSSHDSVAVDLGMLAQFLDAPAGIVGGGRIAAESGGDLAVAHAQDHRAQIHGDLARPRRLHAAAAAGQLFQAHAVDMRDHGFGEPDRRLPGQNPFVRCVSHCTCPRADGGPARTAQRKYILQLAVVNIFCDFIPKSLNLLEAGIG